MNQQSCPSDDLIQAEDLEFYYWLDQIRVPAIQGVSLKIGPGELLALCGPSGSGKSTLLSLLGLIESPQAGTLRVFGDLTTKLSENEKNRIRQIDIGFIFQSFHLFPTLTSEENVEFFLVQQSLSTEERKRRVRSSLEAVGLWEKRKHRPSELSGGQRQRLAIARTVAKKPRLILADEPTSSLDQKTGSEILDLLESLHRELQMTFILASHDPLVLARAQRLIQLQDGREVRA